MTRLSPAEQLIALQNLCRIDDDFCWLWRGSVFLSGTPRMYRPGDGRKGRCVSVRRYVIELSTGMPPAANLYCSSTCGNELCVAPQCLQARTRSQQCLGTKRPADVLARITAANRKCSNRKLNMEKAREIRRRLALDHSGAAIAADYKITHAMVRYIARGDMWKEASPWAGLGV